MAKVVLLVGRTNGKAGDIINVSAAEAKRMIAAGQAKKVVPPLKSTRKKT